MASREPYKESYGQKADRDMRSAEEERSLRDRMAEAREKALQSSEEWRDRVSEKAGSLFSESKSRAVEFLEDTAQALHRTGEKLHEEEQDSIAGYAHSAAERLERLSRYARERDMDDIIEEVEDFARRKPALFIGGAFVLGMVAARLMRSSGEGSGDSAYRSRKYTRAKEGRSYETH